MNNLVLFQNEIDGIRGLVTGPRADELVSRHSLVEGITVQASQYQGLRGKAFVESIRPQELLLKVHFTLPAFPKLPVRLVLGLCRPQTIKKAIELCTVVGVRQLDIVRVAASEKSYLQSKVLSPEEIEKRIVEGLEQNCDSSGPLIRIHHRFKSFMEDTLDGELDEFGARYFADTPRRGFRYTTLKESEPNEHGVIVAVGPEAGWNDFERQSFLDRNFHLLSLGQRMYRTETALALLLGQLKLYLPDGF